jgi:DNA-directed RNA polymerase III subunit RPC11
VYLLTKRYYERRAFQRTEREEVFGGPGAWDNAQKGSVQCPKDGCDGQEAAYFQVQIRSADEPMTSFYKVCGSRLLLLVFVCLPAARLGWVDG